MNSHDDKIVWIIFYFNKLKKGIKKVGISLSSQAASSQVFSASSSLTTVFEMGTGVPWISSTPTSILYHLGYKLSSIFFNIYFLNNTYREILNIYIELTQNHISPKYFWISKHYIVIYKSVEKFKIYFLKLRCVIFSRYFSIAT